LCRGKFFDVANALDPIDWLLDAISEASVTDIDIVNFNYDAFLERSLQKKSIEFSVPLLSEKINTKVRIHKPHGSITFCGKTPLDKSGFYVNYGAGGFTEGGITELEVRYDELDGYFPMVGILPPAGESDRYKHRWIRQIWDRAIEAARSLSENDLVIANRSMQLRRNKTPPQTHSQLFQESNEGEMRVKDLRRIFLLRAHTEVRFAAGCVISFTIIATLCSHLS
jgi:hypothetical protein